MSSNSTFGVSHSTISMKNILQTLTIVFTILVITSACNQNPSNLQEEQQVDITETKFEKGITDTPAEVTKTDTLTFNCSPVNYNPKVLSASHPDSLHADWKDSEVGLAWSLMDAKKITNSNGEFLVGNLVSPRGGTLTNGPYYVIFSEWGCGE